MASLWEVWMCLSRYILLARTGLESDWLTKVWWTGVNIQLWSDSVGLRKVRLLGELVWLTMALLLRMPLSQNLFKVKRLLVSRNCLIARSMPFETALHS
jgi:hypothetical protein